MHKTVVADSGSIAFFINVAAGTYTVVISFAGLQMQESTIVVPQPDDRMPEVWLAEEKEQEEEVVVTATRISRTIANIPTRVEVISGEELAEKGNMKPGDIRMLLNESPVAGPSSCHLEQDCPNTSGISCAFQAPELLD